MKISRYLIMFSLFFTQAHADEPDLQFLGRVLKVDGHNVLTVGDAKGNLRILSLAYISTPVRTEPYFEAVNAHLKGYVGDWFQFTVVSYGRHARVQPVLMRDTKQKSIIGIFNLPFKDSKSAITFLGVVPDFKAREAATCITGPSASGSL